MGKIQKVEYIIIHHSAGDKNTTVDQIRAMHKARGWSDIGYHKVCYWDGSVKQGRSDAVIGAQAFGANSFSLGVLAVGNWDIYQTPEKLLKTLVQVCATLCKRYNLPSSRIIGHNEVSRLFKIPSAATACPGRYLRMEIGNLRKEVDKYLQ